MLITAAEAAKTAAGVAQALAVTACKGLMYETAQLAWKKWTEGKASDARKATDVIASYALKATPPTDGTAGTRCEKAKEKDAVTGLFRQVCKDKLCCGSANKYLKDGSRLTVESCQVALGTTTYEFWPKLQPGALAEPKPQTWRFYCIQGAQRLAATLVAGTAAAYLMA